MAINIRNEEEGSKVKVRDSQRTGDVPIQVQYDKKKEEKDRRNTSFAAAPQADDSEELPANSFEEFINPQDTVLDHGGSGSEDFDDGSYNQDEEPEDEEGEAGPAEDQPAAGYSSLESEKREILVQLHRLRDRGHLVRQFNMQSNIQDMRTELSKINYGLECKRFSDLALQVIVTSVNLLETGNQMFDPFGLDLEGWGQSVDKNKSQLEDPLEELFKKYRNRASIPPELKILIAVGGMGAMVHYRKKWTNRAFGNMREEWEPTVPERPVPVARDPTAPVGPTQRPVQPTGREQPAMQGPPFNLPPHILGGGYAPPQFPVVMPNPINTRLPQPASTGSESGTSGSDWVTEEEEDRFSLDEVPQTARKRNPKAHGSASVGKSERASQSKSGRTTKKQRNNPNTLVI